jgi:hypothetical protein
VHIGYYVFTAEKDGRVARSSQGRVHNGAILRDIDLVAAKHRLDAFLQMRSRSVSSVMRFFEESKGRPTASAVIRFSRSGSSAKSCRRCRSRTFRKCVARFFHARPLIAASLLTACAFVAISVFLSFRSSREEGCLPLASCGHLSSYAVAEARIPLPNPQSAAPTNAARVVIT